MHLVLVGMVTTRNDDTTFGEAVICLLHRYITRFLWATSCVREVLAKAGPASDDVSGSWNEKKNAVPKFRENCK